MQEKINKLLGVLVALSHVVDTNGTGPDTDKVFLKGLALCLDPTSTTEEQIEEYIQLAEGEKALLSPNCLSCQNPCGNTSNYDMKELAEREPDARNMQRTVLLAAEAAAFQLIQRKTEEASATCWDIWTDADRSLIAHLYKIMFYLSLNMPVDYLTEQLLTLGSLL